METMKILKLYVFTDFTQDNGIGVNILEQHDATKSEKTYSAKGLRLPIAEFGVPFRDGGINASKLYYDIWTTQENAKQSVNKCVEKIVEEFRSRDFKWRLVKDTVTKMEAKLIE